MNRDQADALARYLHLCRPEWDQPGIMRALGDAAAGDPLNVGLAAIRWTANPQLRTPGGMGKPGDHWNERVIAVTPRPLRPNEACCNCAQAKHQPNAECDGRAPTRTADVTPEVAHLRAELADTTAEHCSHGTRREHCQEHRPTKTTTEETA